GPDNPVVIDPAAKEVRVKIRVLGPEWTRATHVALYANGVKIKESNIPQQQTHEGMHWQGAWSIEMPMKPTHLVAIATGPGVVAPYWPAARPYQPQSGKWEPTFFGCTGAVWIEGHR